MTIYSPLLHFERKIKLVHYYRRERINFQRFRLFIISNRRLETLIKGIVVNIEIKVRKNRLKEKTPNAARVVVFCEPAKTIQFESEVS